MATKPKDVPRHYFSLDEYFTLEHSGDARWEYWDGDVVSISGRSRQRGQISSNVHYRLRQCLEGGPCKAFTGDQAVKTPTVPPYRYPDASVGCGELGFENIRGVDALLNPVLIVEVLSPTSATRDTEDKFAAYQVISTFREYLLIAQETILVTHYTRRAGGRWTRAEVTDAAGLLTLASIECALAISGIYEGVQGMAPN